MATLCSRYVAVVWVVAVFCAIGPTAFVEYFICGANAYFIYEHGTGGSDGAMNYPAKAPFNTEPFLLLGVVVQLSIIVEATWVQRVLCCVARVD